MKFTLSTHVLIHISLSLVLAYGAEINILEYTRDDFPSEFVFGAGTSAYQYEGAAAEEGRSPSIWDTFTHSGHAQGMSTGDVASDGFHKYKDDVELMVETGLEAYRFSISWSRLLPNGIGAVNQEGLNYYNDLIDELVQNGIQPHITLYHLDLPQVLEDEYKGWLSPKIVDDFVGYADVCFREFGDRVSHWTTVVEPNIIGIASYDNGVFAPGRCSSPFGAVNCTAGNSTTEPYIVVHNILLAHSKSVELYRTKYQAVQKGWIGLNVYTMWYSPFSNSSADVKATERVVDFMIGWVMNPLIYGEYPEVMKKNAGERLPSFTQAQAHQVKDSFDFIGINHYSSVYVKFTDFSKSNVRDFNMDMFASITASNNDTGTGQFVPTTVVVDPQGLQKMLEYFKLNYGNPPIYIQENGYGLGVNDTIKDTNRIDYLSGYIGSMLDAIRNGSDVRGYFVWSFIDVYEFLSGYQSGFGLYRVDFSDNELKRQPKLSAKWYSKFLKDKKYMHLHSFCFGAMEQALEN